MARKKTTSRSNQRTRARLRHRTRRSRSTGPQPERRRRARCDESAVAIDAAGESPDEHEDYPGQTLATRNHDVIRRWAEARGAIPATVPDTERDGRPGVLTFDFPGYGGERLRHISWDEWFRTSTNATSCSPRSVLSARRRPSRPPSRARAGRSRRSRARVARRPRWWPPRSPVRRADAPDRGRGDQRSLPTARRSGPQTRRHGDGGVRVGKGAAVGVTIHPGTGIDDEITCPAGRPVARSSFARRPPARLSSAPAAARAKPCQGRKHSRNA
jgi:hypothetical protein